MIDKLKEVINQLKSSNSAYMKAVLKYLLRNQYLVIRNTTPSMIGRYLLNYIYYIDGDYVKKYNDIELRSCRFRPNGKLYINYPVASNIVKLGKGSYVFYFTNKKVLLDEASKSSTATKAVFTMSIYFLGPNRYKGRKHCIDFIRRYENFLDRRDSTNDKIGSYAITDDYDKNTKYIDAKHYEDVISTKKDTILENIDRWKDMELWYIKHHISHKIGILLYGIPGTGKTSMINMIAHREKRMIISIDLNLPLEMILEGIKRIVKRGMISEVVFVIEDIDCFIDLDGKSDEQKQSIEQKIQWLLQFLDGTESLNQSMVIITTNHYDKIDPRLLRKQRIDISEELEAFDLDCSIQMWERFGLDKDELMGRIDSGEISLPITPVDLQSICIEECYKLLKEERENE